MSDIGSFATEEFLVSQTDLVSVESTDILHHPPPEAVQPTIVNSGCDQAFMSTISSSGENCDTKHDALMVTKPSFSCSQPFSLSPSTTTILPRFSPLVISSALDPQSKVSLRDSVPGTNSEVGNQS